jgi:hypothetical protein
LLLVELKATDGIAAIHIAQVISYLKASGLELGLILNFHSALMRQGIRRVLPPRRPHRSPIPVDGWLPTDDEIDPS